MPIFSMLARSIVSYSIFLLSRKIVRGGIGIAEGVRKSFQLHRCENCWRLYSGEINSCSFCGEHTKPLYNVYKEDNYGPYENSEEFERREGLERQVYNDTREFKFKPLTPRKLEVPYDRSPRRDHREPSEPNKGRGGELARCFFGDRIGSG
jgi:hypothetical protein